jgi:Protein of unknown function (DUF3631)
LAQDEAVEPSWLERLLQELWVIFVDEKCKDIQSAALVKRLTADPTSVWCEYGRGHRVTQREVAALLRKLHIRPGQVGEDRLGGYHAADFFKNEIFQRFLHRDPLILSPSPTGRKKSDRQRKKRG